MFELIVDSIHEVDLHEYLKEILRKSPQVSMVCKGKHWEVAYMRPTKQKTA